MNPVLKAIDPSFRHAPLQKEAKSRSTGKWESWTIKNFPKGSAGSGWAADFNTCYVNGIFSVLDRELKTSWGKVRHLAVASLSGIRPSWHEMQRIKNEIAGPSTTAIEVYPPDDRVVDEADMFHVWVLPSKLPFGIHGKDVADAASAS